MDGQKSAVHTKLSDITTNSFKLLLQGCSLNSSFKCVQNSTFTTLFSNNDDQEPSFTGSNLSSRKHNGWWNIMRFVLRLFRISILGIFFFLSEFTVVVGILLQLVWFSSHSWFVILDTRASNDNTVYWNIHTGNDLDNVTDLNEVVVKLLFFALPHHSYLYETLISSTHINLI